MKDILTAFGTLATAFTSTINSTDCVAEVIVDILQGLKTCSAGLTGGFAGVTSSLKSLPTCLAQLAITNLINSVSVALGQLITGIQSILSNLITTLTGELSTLGLSLPVG